MTLIRICAILLLGFTAAVAFGLPSESAERELATLLPDVVLKQINTEGNGVPVVVFNPLSWARTDAVEVDSPFTGEDPNVVVTDSGGKQWPARNLADKLYFTARDVPALGYKVFWARRVPEPVASPVKCTAESMENQYFRVSIDKYKGVITGVYDKINGRQVLRGGTHSALLRVVHGGRAIDLVGDSMAVMMDSGPARGVVMLDHGHGNSPFVQEVTLHDGVPRVDIRLTADWWEAPPAGQKPGALMVAFSPSVRAKKATAGCIEPAGGSGAILRWIDCSDSGYGMSILADRAYGVDYAGGKLLATVLKQDGTAREPSDEAAWEANYALYAHKGDWRGAGVFRRAFEVGYPLTGVLVDKRSGPLPKVASLVSMADSNVVAAAVGARPDGSLALRLYETGGKSRTVTVSTNKPAIGLVEIAQTESARGSVNKLQVKLTAYSSRDCALMWN